MYYAIFHSHLIYSCQVWGQNKSSIKRISTLQKKAVRLINFAKYNEHTNPLFHHSKIIKLFDHISRENLFVHKFVSNSLPSAFERYFDFLISVHGYETRNASLGLMSKNSYNTTLYGRHSIKNNPALSWNYFQTNLSHLKFSELKFNVLKNEINDFIYTLYTND